MDARIPEEVVSHILSFLPVPDRKSASLVSRKWLRASRHPALMRDLVVDASAYFASGGRAAFADWKRFIHSLSLGRSELTVSDLCGLLDGCCNLRSLDLGGCNNFFFLGGFVEDQEVYERLRRQLGGVRWLGLANVGQLTSASLQRAVGLFAGLRGLSLAGCPLVFSAGVQDALGHQTSSFVLGFDAVLRLLARPESCLSELDLSFTGVTDKALESLGGVPGLRLRVLSLNGCQEISADGVARLLRLQPALRELSLAKNRHLGPLSERQLSSASLAALQRLTAASSSAFVADRLLLALAAQAAELTGLDLSACDRVHSDALAELLSSAPGLQSLVASHCPGLDDRVLRLSAPRLRCLVRLDIASCSGVTDEGFRLLCGHLGQLRCLRAAWLKAVTDYGVLGLRPAKDDDDDSSGLREGAKRREEFPHYKRAVCVGDAAYRPPSLEELQQLRRCSTEASGDAGVGPEFSLRRLSRLRSLDLSQCPKVTRVALRELLPAENFPFKDLEELRLLMNKHVDDECLRSLANGASCLHTLHLSGASVTDSGVSALAGGCHRLRSLSLSNCDGVTDASLRALANCDSLRSLELAYCASISQSGVDDLCAGAPLIRDVRTVCIGTGLVGK